MNVAVRDLKNRLSEYLRRVRKGERIVVTDRGLPIAEISALATEELTPDQRLDRLAEAGELLRPRGGGLADVRPMRRRGRPVSETLLEDRR